MSLKDIPQIYKFTNNPGYPIIMWYWSSGEIGNVQLLLCYDFLKHRENFLGDKPPLLQGLWVSGKPGHQATQIQCTVYLLI